MIDGLELDLERKEWESEWFSALWLRLAVNRKDE
jgi:hypothetical protein